MPLTRAALKDLYSGYNNVNEGTIQDLINYLFQGATTADSISQASTAGLKIGLAGTKLGFFGATPVVRQTVSNTAFAIPTDLPTAITQITNLQTVVASMRTALGNTVMNLFNVA